VRPSCRIYPQADCLSASCDAAGWADLQSSPAAAPAKSDRECRPMDCCRSFPAVEMVVAERADAVVERFAVVLHAVSAQEYRPTGCCRGWLVVAACRSGAAAGLHPESLQASCRKGCR